MADIKAVGGLGPVLCHTKHCPSTQDVGKKSKDQMGRGLPSLFSKAFTCNCC